MYAPKKKIDFYGWHTLRERNTTIAQVCHFTTQLRLNRTIMIKVVIIRLIIMIKIDACITPIRIDSMLPCVL